jgi:hypothetical protein
MTDDKTNEAPSEAPSPNAAEESQLVSEMVGARSLHLSLMSSQGIVGPVRPGDPEPGGMGEPVNSYDPGTTRAPADDAGTGTESPADASE